MISRATVTSDSYQERHLVNVFHGWGKLAYGALAIFTGYLAVMVYFTKATIIEVPILGWTGYLMFQIMTAGVAIIGLYGALWSPKRGEIEQGRVTFSFWGFWVGDFFMMLVFFPFAIVIARMLLSGGGKGAFIDMGGWDALSNPSLPWEEYIPLLGMALIIGLAGVVMALIPLWLFWRSLLSLGVIIKRGTTTALFNAKKYTPGNTLYIQIKTSRKENESNKRRVFLNYVTHEVKRKMKSKNAVNQRQYFYSEFKDMTVRQLEDGLSFEIPSTLDELSLKSSHLDQSDLRYWEILVEEPTKNYWARFIFLVS